MTTRESGKHAGRETTPARIPIAYLITFHTYGTRLHGDAKGSVDKRHNEPDSPSLSPNPVRASDSMRKMATKLVLLDAPMRHAVERAVTGVCEHRAWRLLAVHVRTNHLHVVVGAPAPPERVMTTFKIWATRGLVEAELIEPGSRVWSRHGSTRYLWDRNGLEGAIEYTLHGQGWGLG